MELVDESFGNQAHDSALHPYSQYLKREGEEWFWVVNSLSDEAGNAIYLALKDRNTLHLIQHNMDVGLTLFEEKHTTAEELKEIFLRSDHSCDFRIRFLTPTSFKRKGEYLLFPDLFCIYQSLMKRFDCATGMGIFNEESLEELVERSRIIEYRLNSTFFCMEKVRIPSYMGTVTVRLKGNAMMNRFAHMLFQFGEYSGIGIKTALGMGAVQLL